MTQANRFLPPEDLMDDLDGLHAGEDSDSGIRSAALMSRRISELAQFIDRLEPQEPSRMVFLDVFEAVAWHLYGEDPYGAEDRWTFMQWLGEQTGFDLP